MNKIFKCILISLLLGVLGTLLFQALSWKPPDINGKSQRKIHSCIQEDASKLNFRFQSDHNIHFDVDFVQNSKPSCINPYFPTIHIKTNGSHNAWLHIVYTDSKVPEWQTFIDSEHDATKPSPYPFYTHEPDFYDAPLWTYSLVNKPISFWKGHTFAIEVNHQNKTIKCLGGIEWGFELRLTKLHPLAIQPRLLDEEDWKQAWELVKDKLPNYESIN